MEKKINPLFKVNLLSDEGIDKANRIAAAFNALTDALAADCPPSRELSIAYTKLEEACFFAKKSVAIACPAGPKLPVAVTMNGSLFMFQKATATYEELAELAGFDPANTPTILVQDLQGKRKSQSPVRGESVELYDSVAIHVCMTTNA